jgi:hypothetical protein
MNKPNPTQRRQFLFAMALGSASRPSLALTPQSPLQRLQTQLKTSPVLRGEFEQTKTLKGFKNPLRSSGIFLVAKERGVVWQTQKPFASRLVVTPDQMTSRQADGRINTQISAKNEPGIRAINDTLFALMSIDWPTLSKRFDFEIQFKEGNTWHLKLTPRDSALTQWLSHIELQGDQFLRTVHLTEPQGDTNQITLRAHNPQPQLNLEDAALFE